MVVVPAFNPSTWEAEVEDICEFQDSQGYTEKPLRKQLLSCVQSLLFAYILTFTYII